jgi:hypothetical protein
VLHLMITVLRRVMPCSLVDVLTFGGPYCLRFQGTKTAIFVANITIFDLIGEVFVPKINKVYYSYCLYTPELSGMWAYNTSLPIRHATDSLDTSNISLVS